MDPLFSFINDCLNENKPVMLMTVVDSQGSSPGKVGFKLAVSSNGQLKGSIGGGTMEHRLVERAKKELKQEKLPAPYLLFQDHQPEAEENRSGLICSGNQTIIFYALTQADQKIILNILATLNQGEKGVLELNTQQLSFEKGAQLPQPSEAKVVSENDWTYREQLGLPDAIYIFGGGHVGLAVSKLFRMLNFQVHIFDNRKNLNTLTENGFAHEKKVINYLEAGSYVPEGYNVYVIIVSFAHKSDEQLLKQMLHKKIKYLGMMGSEKKVATIFENLQHEGFDPALLKKVHSPIGIPIKSETPEEIAVSIAAQIIDVKNSHNAN